ncbi:MAG: hypothetical protein ABI165_15765, partial [Bryobacteraceae bacterium]
PAGTWNRAGVILFGGFGKLIERVSAAGGAPSPVLPKEDNDQNPNQLAPQFLPDGKHFLYGAFGGKTGIFVGSLDGKQSHLLMQQTDSPAFYAPSTSGGPGFLLFLRQDTLMAQPFDPDKAAFQGDAVPVASPLANGPTFQPSANGALLLRRSQASPPQLIWLDRDGKRLGTVGEPGNLRYPRLSPDQKTVAVARGESGKRDIWLYDQERGAETRFTFDGDDAYPVWSPDGQRIAYGSFRTSENLVVIRPANGMGKETVLFRSQPPVFPVDWSRDGRWLTLLQPFSGPAISLLPASGDGKPTPVIPHAFDERDGCLSPDGRWMLYTSGPSGRREVFVQSLPESAGGPAGGGKWQISTAGGQQPAWRPDGKEIFYLAGDGTMMAVPVESGPATLKAGAPKALFPTHLNSNSILVRNYDVSIDGKRFLLAEPVEGAAPEPLTVILNWQSLLKSK